MITCNRSMQKSLHILDIDELRPVVQAILDGLGNRGNPAKQLFAAEFNKIYEWLREVHRPDTATKNASFLRRVAGQYYSGHTTPHHRGRTRKSISSIETPLIVSNLNAWCRISGRYTKLPWSDVEAFSTERAMTKAILGGQPKLQ